MTKENSENTLLFHMNRFFLNKYNKDDRGKKVIWHHLNVTTGKLKSLGNRAWRVCFLLGLANHRRYKRWQWMVPREASLEAILIDPTFYFCKIVWLCISVCICQSLPWTLDQCCTSLTCRQDTIIGRTPECVAALVFTLLLWQRIEYLTVLKMLEHRCEGSI